MEPTTPHESSESDTASQPAPPEAEPNELEQSIQEAEELLKAVKERYEQVQVAKTQQPEFEARLLELKTELETVKTQLAQTWEDLESQLITWRDKQELFWQFLRFAGIGFALAMLINAFVK